MFHPENPDESGIEDVILLCIRKILEHQEAGLFLSWAQKAIPELLRADWQDLPDGEDRRLAFLLASAIWNATPLPSLGFRVQPMHTPELDAPCPCGSGLTYESCCAQVTDAPELPAELMWELLLAELDDRGIRQALQSGKVPVHLLGLAAERLLTEDRPGRAVALLEPLFAEHAPAVLDERFEHTLNVLCDAYDRLNHWKKKLAFLERMTEQPCRELRSAAWQRLCTIQIDEGDFTAAQFAFSQAQREGPDSPGTALLEITLLASQHEDELARNRAVFWLHKLQRAGIGDKDILDFLQAAARDPQNALMTSQSSIIDPRLMMLRDWIQTASLRPLPTYGLKPCKRGSAPDASLQLPLFGDTDAAGARMPSPDPLYMARLCAPAALQRLEPCWHELLKCPKPTSTNLLPMPLGDFWERDDWVEFLTAHPEAADSLDILDDLVTALYVHPESALPWINRSLLTPLLERARRILGRVLPEPSSRTIPWSAEENRPALRLLFRLYLARVDEGRERDAVEILHTLLRLNPSDNHGVRAELMNHYLRQHENEKALDLAERFPDDQLADLAFGEVLALYRLGAQNQAHHVLTRARERLPRITRYLTRKRVPRPSDGGTAASSRDEDEARLYREAMLDVWEAEPGLLDWLRKQVR
jgi:tetratricopeptide (TPR) repeat protein